MNYRALDLCLEFLDNNEYDIFDLVSLEIQNESVILNEYIESINENKFTDKLKEIGQKFLGWLKKAWTNLLSIISKVSNYIVVLRSKMLGTIAGKALLAGDIDERINGIQPSYVNVTGLPDMPVYKDIREHCKHIQEDVTILAEKIQDISDYIRNIKPAPKKNTYNSDKPIERINPDDVEVVEKVDEATALLNGPVKPDNSDYDWADDVEDAVAHSTEIYEAAKEMYDKYCGKDKQKLEFDENKVDDLVKYSANLVATIEYLGANKAYNDYKSEVFDISKLTKAYNSTVQAINSVRNEYDKDSQVLISKDISLLGKVYTQVFKTSMLECRIKYEITSSIISGMGIINNLLATNKEIKKPIDNKKKGKEEK